MVEKLLKPARDLLTALAGDATLSSSNDVHRWAGVNHRTPKWKLKSVNFDLVKSLFNAGYLDRVERPGISINRFAYHLTAAGRAAVESFTAPKES
jgi:hypothetical protein